MAKTFEATLTCNKCGEEFPITVYESINVTMEKDLKEKVINKSIFEFTCPKCGEFHRIIYPFLYVDMEKMYMVYLANQETNLNDLRDQQIIQATDYLHNYECRAVLDMHELSEKILIHELGLNDKVIEVIKLFAVTKSDIDRKELRNTFFAGLEDNALRVDLVMKNNAVQRVLVPMSGYENCYKLNKEFFDTKEDEWVQLNVHWALDFLDKQAKGINVE